MKEELYYLGIYTYNNGKVAGFRFSNNNEPLSIWPERWLFFRIEKNFIAEGLESCWKDKVIVDTRYDYIFSVRL